MRIAWLLACHQEELSVISDATAPPTVDPTDLNEVVKTTKREEIDTFSSKIIHGWTKTLLLGSNMNVMTQILRGGNGPYLPHGLSVVNTYTKVTTGSKQVAVMVKNLTGILITVTKGIKVTQVVAVNVVPPMKLTPGTLERLDKIQGSQQTRM